MEDLKELLEEAKVVVEENLSPTPLIKNDFLSRKYNANIYLKLENLQPVGSFKLRGALFKLHNLSQEEKEKGVLAVSAGNHAQGVAWASQKFNIKSCIIMPVMSPMIKILNTENLGAKVILYGENIDEGFVHAKEMVEKTGMTFVHPFDDKYIVAGQSTLGFELLDQLKDIDYVFSGIGGGGLLSGVGTVLKNKSQAKIIGAQATGSSSMVKSLREKTIVGVETANTFADGIKVKNATPSMFNILKEVLDDYVDVSDEKIAMSVLTLMEHARVIAEGAGAISLAAFDKYYQEHQNEIKGKNIVLIVSGGNIDINLIDRIIDKGLIESKRRVKYTILLDDKPLSLNSATELIGKLGGNILQVVHDREVPNLDLQKSAVVITVETKGIEHANEIDAALVQDNYIVSHRIF